MRRLRHALNIPNNSRWMTVPWDTVPRTIFDEVIDICTLSPSIVAKAHCMKNVPPDQLLPWCLSITSDIASLIHKFDAFYSKFSESHEGVQLFWEQAEPQNGYIVDEDEPNSLLRFIPTLWFSNLDTASMFFMYCAYSHHFQLPS